jgi:cytoskeletal protein RodZ
LEESNFSKLPDQVFAKGFVRSYARSLGLDEDDAMRRFEQSAGAFYDKQLETEQLRLKQVEDEKRKKANRKVVVAAAGVALLGLVLLLTREQSSVSSPRRVVQPESRVAPAVPVQPRATPSLPESVLQAPEKEEAPPVTGTAPSTLPEPSVSPRDREATLRGQHPADRSSPRAGERPEPVPSSAPEPMGEIASSPLPQADLEPVTGQLPLVLDLEAVDLSWVVVQVDDGSPHEALLRPGDRVRWKAQDRFIVTLGNAGGVRVELDGKPQGPFGLPGKVARDIVLKR